MTITLLDELDDLSTKFHRMSVDEPEEYVPMAQIIDAAIEVISGKSQLDDLIAHEFAKNLWQDLSHLTAAHDIEEEERGGDFDYTYEERLRHAAEERIAESFKRAAQTITK